MLVFNTIPVSCISRVIFQNEYQLREYVPLLSKLGIAGVCGNYFFSPRRDYRYWSKAA
ncbi:MAG: hypothetical protein K6G27_15795 [Lachnospiraceae bacterium]|nr:hypothetical protein [Lachnospiraceae bacterium]